MADWTQSQINTVVSAAEVVNTVFGGANSGLFAALYTIVSTAFGDAAHVESHQAVPTQLNSVLSQIGDLPSNYSIAEAVGGITLDYESLGITFKAMMEALAYWLLGDATFRMHRYANCPHFYFADLHTDTPYTTHPMTAFLVDYKVDPRDRVAGEAEVDFLSRVTVHADWEEDYNGTSVVGRHHVTLEDEVGWDVYYSPYGHTDPGLRGGFYPITWYVPSSGPPVRAGLLDMLLLASLAPVQWQPGS